MRTCSFYCKEFTFMYKDEVRKIIKEILIKNKMFLSSKIYF